jgi:hypothetical protein
MLTVKYAKNPVWGSDDGQQIQLIVRFEEINQELPFNATSYDCESHGVDLYNRAKAGEFGEVAPFVPYVSPTA